MNTVSPNIPRVVLHPGDFHVSDSPMTLSTLLGSCVAVCLYDPVRGVMGMNHFLLANRRYSKDLPILASEAGRYGIHAMELLVNGLLARGGKRRHLKAKAFGGGNVLGRSCNAQDNFLCVGAINVRFVREFLHSDGIPLVAADLGGNYGRQIHFTGADYSVYMRRIPVGQSSHLVDEERLYWKRSVEEHDHAAPRVELW
jgi:chemotaxis protein CheD